MHLISAVIPDEINCIKQPTLTFLLLNRITGDAGQREEKEENDFGGS
jgi:hypothetical protein